VVDLWASSPALLSDAHSSQSKRASDENRNLARLLGLRSDPIDRAVAAHYAASLNAPRAALSPRLRSVGCCANSRYRQYALASCICPGVRQSASNTFGDATRTQMHLATGSRDIEPVQTVNKLHPSRRICMARGGHRINHYRRFLTNSDVKAQIVGWRRQVSSKKSAYHPKAMPVILRSLLPTTFSKVLSPTFSDRITNCCEGTVEPSANR
jgi:hypothetical protein